MWRGKVWEVSQKIGTDLEGNDINEINSTEPSRNKSQ